MKKPFTFTISSRNIDELQLYLRACELISPDPICTQLTLEEIIQVVKAIHHAYDEKVRNSSLGLGPDVNLEHLETLKELFSGIGRHGGRDYQRNSGLSLFVEQTHEGETQR